MRIVFMGTPEFAVPALDSLSGSEHEIVAVYTRPDKPLGRGRGIDCSPVKKKALACGLTLAQPKSLKAKEEKDNLADLRPDLIVAAAYGLMLPRNILELPPFGCINIHPSLLPRYRGPSPVAAATLAGDEVTGVSLMLMNEGLDTGPVLAQYQLSISPEDTTGSLTGTLSRMGAQLLMESLPLWFEGCLIPRPQDDGEAVYSKIINKKDGEINWGCSAVDLWRQVRAFQPWPGSYTFRQGKMLKILEAVPLPGEGGEPGRVIAIKEAPGATVGVQTGDGILGLLTVQMEGKRPVPVADFVRGQRDFIGTRLPN